MRHALRSDLHIACAMTVEENPIPSFACAVPIGSGPATGTLRMNLVFGRDFRSATTWSGVSNSVDAPRWTIGGSSSDAIRSMRAISAERNRAETTEGVWIMFIWLTRNEPEAPEGRHQHRRARQHDPRRLPISPWLPQVSQLRKLRQHCSRL